MELHGEFMNLHNWVLSRNPETFGAAEFKQYGNLLKDNIRLICTRLRDNFRVYDDITVLVTRFLAMLDLGASLCLGGTNKSQSKISKIITQTTPFIGGNKHATTISVAGSSKSQIKVQMHQLSSLVLHHGANSSSLASEAGLSSLKDIFQSLHYVWKTQLVEDQKEAAEKSSTYRYKGSYEDSEEVDEMELRELFPVYEGNEQEESEKSRMDITSISLKLTELHAAIFAPGDVEANLRQFIVESTRLLGSLSSGEESSAAPKSYLPGILLVLKDELKSYENVSPSHYNFYLDANIAEAKRLVSLVLSVRTRFVQLQAAWPDHAAIHDVLVCCQEILQFKHLEPVAKYITKLEKLHGLVHEWQLVASKEYTAASLYDEITALTISWRRLELSTWAKLLDLEFEKCEQAVSTWWFVAYEAFIALPLQKAENGEDLKDYTTEALHTLEAFLKSTTIGQFSARLRLIEQFRSLLLLFTKHNPVLGCIVSALENFLHHYRPYEPVISKTLEEKGNLSTRTSKSRFNLPVGKIQTSRLCARVLGGRITSCSSMFESTESSSLNPPTRYFNKACQNCKGKQWIVNLPNRFQSLCGIRRRLLLSPSGPILSGPTELQGSKIRQLLLPICCESTHPHCLI